MVARVADRQFRNINHFRTSHVTCCADINKSPSNCEFTFTEMYQFQPSTCFDLGVQMQFRAMMK